MCIVENPMLILMHDPRQHKKHRVFISIAMTRCQALKPLETLFFAVFRHKLTKPQTISNGQ